MDYKKSVLLRTLISTLLVILIIILFCVIPQKHNEKVETITQNSYEKVETVTQNSLEKITSTTNLTTTTTQITTNSTITTQQTEKIISVNNILQNPELPTGCEITSTTILLNYYGFNVTKMEMVQLLPKSSDWYWSNGKLVVPNPNKYFMGDPTKTNGYGLQCFAPVIQNTLNKYLQSQNSLYKAINITGTNLEDLYKYINNNQPVITWVSIGMVQPYKNTSWIDEEGKVVTTYKNLHCLVMNGYDKNYIYVTDPLGTLSKVNKQTFKDRYNYIGKQAVIIQ